MDHVVAGGLRILHWIEEDEHRRCWFGSGSPQNRRENPHRDVRYHEPNALDEVGLVAVDEHNKREQMAHTRMNARMS